MADCSYNNASTIDMALELAGQHEGEYVFSAGGTDLQLYRKQKLNLKPHIIDLSEIKELNTIKLDGERLSIGSMVTLVELSKSSVVGDFCPAIIKATKLIATPVIRETATVGGNLMVANRCNFYNQSKSWREAAGSCVRDVGDTCLAVGGGDKCFSRNVSDLAPLFIALDAALITQNSSETRTLPLLDLYAPDGVTYHTGPTNNGIIKSIVVDTKPKQWFYRKLRRRQSIDYTSLTVAAAVDVNSMARICLNGVSMSPVLLPVDLSNYNLTDIITEAKRACKTVDNDFIPLKYRRDMIDVYLTDFFQHIDKGQ